MSPRERLEFYRNKKLQKRRQQKLASYHKNKTVKQTEYKQTSDAIRKRMYRAKQAETRQKEKERKRKYRNLARNKNVELSANTKNSNEMIRHVFKNRTSKHRALKKIKGFVTLITKEAVSYTGSIFEKFKLSNDKNFN